MQQQIFTKDFIFDRIEDSNAPYWNLALCQGFKNTVNVMNYNGVDFEDDDSDEAKIKKSKAQLEKTLSTFIPECVFLIELRGAMTSSRNGIFGPFQFSNSDKPAQPEPTAATAQPETPTATAQPLGATIPPGYVPESALKGIQDALQSDFDKKFELYKQETEHQRKEEEFMRRCQLLDEREKDIKDKEKEYNSSVAKAADVLIEIGKKIGAYFLMPKGDGNGAMVAQMAQQPQLGATQHRNDNDPKADAVDDFAAFLYDNFSADDIKTLKQNIINLSQNGDTNGMAQPDSNGTATDAIA